MKKMLYVALAAVFLFAALSTVALAAQNVTNPAQKGSLLVWPKIVVDRNGVITADTVVTIVNDYTAATDVKCYWMDEYQNIQDFQFRITKNQVIWFRASDGMGMEGTESVLVPPFDGSRGELKCWAVNDFGTRQVSWNHLFGSATIYDYDDGEAWEYSTWNFAARNVARDQPVGAGGTLALTGADGGYDACPEYLLGTFVAKSDVNLDVNVGSDLTLVPCKQDLRQDRTPTYTKAQFDIWNEDEVKSTGAYMCLKCWLETTLEPKPVYSAGAGTYRNFDKFGIDSLHTSLGFFRVTGVFSTACKATDWHKNFPPPYFGDYKTVPTPLIGLRSHSLRFPGFDPGDSVGTTLNTAGFDGSGFVLWDVQWAHPELNGR